MLLIDLIVFLNMITPSVNTLEFYLCENTRNVTSSQLKNFIEVYHATHDFNGSWEDWQKLTPEQRRNPDESFEVIILGELQSDDLYHTIFLPLGNLDRYILVRTNPNNKLIINWLKENLIVKQF